MLRVVLSLSSKGGVHGYDGVGARPHIRTGVPADRGASLAPLTSAWPGPLAPGAALCAAVEARAAALRRAFAEADDLATGTRVPRGDLFA